MRAAALLIAATAVAAAAVPAAPATAAGISRARIARAVSRAERSRSLWATVNVCNAPHYPDAIGVRGQMPALGFWARLQMVVQVDYWSASEHRFVPIQSPAATTTVQLGPRFQGLHQGGAVFPFSPHTGLLNATITFSWIRGHRVIGETRRRTTGGHPEADFGSPPQFSAAQCRIP